MNGELYQVPTLVLLAALVAVFGSLWLQWRSYPGRGHQIEPAPPARQRHLLWLTGWSLAVLRLCLVVSGRGGVGIGRAMALVCLELAPLMFLSSLAPQYFLKRLRMLCAVAFGIPVALYTVTVALDRHPGHAAHIALLLMAAATVYVAAAWAVERSLLPVWLSLLVVAPYGGACLWLTAHAEYMTALYLVRSGMLLMTALLFASAFRRLTAGVIFTVGGLAVWALPGILDVFMHAVRMPLELTRFSNLLRLLTAVGMIVLVMEDEIAANQATYARERQARMEMERYSRLYLGAMPYEPTPDEYDDACQAIADVSRFTQAAVFFRNAAGSFQLAGQSGFLPEQALALDGLARRITDERAQAISRSEEAEPGMGHLMTLDLSPVLQREDEAALGEFRKVRVLGIRARQGSWQGALLLGAIRNPKGPLQNADLMTLELLVARMGAAREHSLLLRQLMQSERLAGLGQLASSVAHELNNPLTAVSGFAELLSESGQSEVQERAAIILNEARRMKKIVESLVRFRKLVPAGRTPVSVELLLRDIEKLARHDLESARVELELRIPGDLPRAVGDGEQIRQVFLQLVKNASIALEDLPEGDLRQLTVEVAKTAGILRTTFTDNGPGFSDPTRAFDPFLTTRHTGEGVGLGLSLCYSIVQEQGGEISAENVQPRGARVTVDLPLEEAAPVTSRNGDADNDLLAPAM